MNKLLHYSLLLLLFACSPSAKETETTADSTEVASDVPIDELHDADYGIYHYTFAVNKNLPRFSLKFHPPDKKIYLYSNPDEEEPTSQEIPFSEDIDYEQGIYAENADANFILADYNFDGYRDIAVVSSSGANNVWHNIHLFDPGSGQFVINDEVSKLTSVEVDSVGKVLRYHDNGGMAGAWYADGIIQWEKGKPVTIREEEQTSDAANQEIFIRTIRVRGADGQLKVASVVEISEGVDQQEIQCLQEGEWAEFDKSPRLIYAASADKVIRFDGRDGVCDEGDEGH